MRTTERCHQIRNPRSATRKGFTLVEMLTVIGIIVLLVSILLPVVSSVRTRGHQADTQAMLARIAAGIESYHGDFRAYPGPLHNGQIYNGGMPVDIDGVDNPTQITMSENLVLGLLGGLAAEQRGERIVLTYKADRIGNGPVSLSPRNPKKFRAYMDKVSLSDPGDYPDDQGTPDGVKDSAIPEFLDRFPDPMPILYMRAKTGAPGIVSNKQPIGTQQQYDLKQIEAYTTANIGVGREPPSSDEFAPSAPSGNDRYKHGLQKVDPMATAQNPPPSQPPGLRYVYPYDLYGFMRHPSMANMPRQKDAYILISSGPDRLYGTRDDAVYPPSR